MTVSVIISEKNYIQLNHKIVDFATKVVIELFHFYPTITKDRLPVIISTLCERGYWLLECIII